MAAPTESAEQAQPAAGQPDNEKGSDQLEEVVVTAQKRSESAQRVPVIVQSISGDMLAATGVKDLFQAVNLVPGAVFSRAPDDGLALTFHGLGTTARPQAFEQSVALFVDGTFMGKGRLYSTAFFDVDRMEFIKGTQSTLLGKNASLGAISVISNQPTDKFSVETRAGYEVVDHGYTADGVINMPLTNGVNLRVAAHYNDLNGWLRNEITGNQVPEHKDLGVRAILAAQLSDAVQATASYQYAENKQIGSNYFLIGNIPAKYGPGVLGDTVAQFTSLTQNGDTFHDTKSHVASLKLDVDVGENKLIAQTSYIAYKLGFLDDFDWTADDTVNFGRDETYSQVSQELRIQSPQGATLEYMAGMFYMHSHWDSQERQLWNVPAFPPSPSPISGQLFNGSFINNYTQAANTYSGFASGTWNIAPRLRLSGGVRLTRETKDVIYGRTPLAPFTIWNSVANPPFDPTPLTHNSTFVDGNASLQYDFTPTVMGYVSFGHGSKSGGFVESNTIAVPPSLLVGGKVPAGLVSAGAAIADEFTKTYEVGLKTTLLDRRLRFNAAAFWTDIQNFQDTVFTGGPLGFITFNGPARSRGVEFDSAFQVNPSLRLEGSATYADATTVIQPIDPATSLPEVNAAGNPVFGRYQRSQAPKVISNLNGTYEHPITQALEVHLGAGVRHRSSMFNQRQEQFPSAQLTTLELSAGIESRDGHWSVDAVGKNITNAKAEDFASPTIDPRFGAFYGAHMAGVNALRTVMISAHYKY